ncbi:tRNA modification GTPase GTPBP3, mitochondrial isoform X2 [Xenopus laevis]|uniref:tRNA modification GTPase GTPBP3, mitochondrial isoform X2 n=1 Tax=Xenopus laevis TaxID=8355 RepID=A0A8J0U3M0_XENLA|nr:tRNA modification GTPase GTPBP3, mitochondrial isoform X2 [Xenopus laevis]
MQAEMVFAGKCLTSVSFSLFKRRHHSVVRDTIFALSSGHGKCGVSVIRTSGPASGDALRLLTGWKQLPSPRRVTLTSLLCPATGELLDRGLVVWFAGPKSFTGEDCCEYHVHGGPAVVMGVLQALGSVQMLRPAEPGEFTKRAFQNGKLDLTEAEGLGDLIHAETEIQRRQALRQMSGDLGQLYQKWSRRLVTALAHIEAFIDFSEDDNVEENVLTTGQKPAAIVSPIPGTTRDVVETVLNIGGYPVIMSDTAGLRESEDPIEKEGVRRAKERLDNADIIITVVDASKVLLNRISILTHLKNLLSSPSSEGNHREVLLVLNKSDLLHPEGLDKVQELCEDPELPTTCFLSCQTSQGVGDFINILTQKLEKICGDPLHGAPSLTQTRHRLHLNKCLSALERYTTYREQDLVLAAEELRISHRELGAITGKVGVEEILDIIFRDFCIGK